MELALNLGWMALATAMCWLWVRHARREGRGRSAQFVSLALVLVIMFVVITMYDDMAMAQNPAETRCFQREDDLGAHAHAPFHPVVASTPRLPRSFLSTRFALRAGQPPCRGCEGSRPLFHSESPPSRRLIHSSSFESSSRLVCFLQLRRSNAQRPLQKETLFHNPAMVTTATAI